MPVVFTDLAVRATIHLPKYLPKWVIAISRSEAEPDGNIKKPTLIIQQGGWCKAHFKTTDYKLKTLIGTNAVLWEFPVIGMSFISCNLSSCICTYGGRGRVASRIFRAGQNSWY